MGLTILLVDDDKLLTEKLKSTVDWETLNISMVFTANNIHEAESILEKYRVDILLTDVDMPMGSGLELVEWVREQKLDMKCVFLSSYANFSYAQKAIQLGSANYLLKPISNRELVQELQEVTKSLKNAYSERQGQERLAREKFWQEIMIHSSNYREEDQIESPLIQGEELVRVLLFYMIEDRSRRKTVQELAILDYAFRGMAERCLADFNPEICVAIRDTTWMVILRGESHPLELKKRIRELEEQFLLQNGEYLVANVSEVREKQYAHRSMNRLKEMRSRGVPNEERILCESSWSGTIKPYPEPNWGAWREELRSKSHYGHLIGEISEYLEKAAASGGFYLENLASFVRKFHELVYSGLQSQNLSFDQVYETREYESGMNRARQTLQDCRDFVSFALEKLDGTKKGASRNEHVIRRLRNYIEENLDKDLSRSTLAQQVYLSEDYITKLFVKETGMSLPAYISGRRMERAKTLLQDSSKTISHIALEVGYTNFSYFSKTFRDYTGKTPNEYRTACRS